MHLNNNNGLTKLINNKTRLFWALQLAGWSALALVTYLVLTLWYAPHPSWLNWLHNIGQSLIALLLSLFLRCGFLALWSQPLLNRAALCFTAITCVALIWNAIRIQLFITLVHPGFTPAKPLTQNEYRKVTLFFDFNQSYKPQSYSSQAEKVFLWHSFSQNFSDKPYIISFPPFYQHQESQNQKSQHQEPQQHTRFDYRVIDFGGTYTTFVSDPLNKAIRLAKTTKPISAKPWAGTIISGDEGLKQALDLSTHKTFSLWTYSPEANIPIRVKLEELSSSFGAIEVEVKTQFANQWEKLTFDFGHPIYPQRAIEKSLIWKEFGGWYFSSLLIFMCWSSLYHGIKYALLFKEQRNQAEVHARKAELQSLIASQAEQAAKLQMLRYQLNPHFLFNTLNAIYALVKLGENTTAKNMLTQLSRFLRATLDINPDQLITLAEEIDTLALYTNIERYRFEENLTIDIDIENGLRDSLVPSLLLQPLVENAIKYAVSKNENGGHISISAKNISERIQICVIDDGPGVSLANENITSVRGVGLDNTKKRLDTLYGGQHIFRLEEVVPHGLKVFIEIPYKNNQGDTP